LIARASSDPKRTEAAAGTADPRAFLAQIPVGVVQFGNDGAVEFANQAALDLLVPVCDGEAPVNLFQSLRLLCPELAAKVAAFTAASGCILDQRRINALAGDNSVTFSLTVNRVAPGIQLGVIRDVTRLTEMLAFAFASADLLINADMDGTIRWAGGTFRTLLGMQPQDAVGLPVAGLFCAADRRQVENALMVAGLRRRLAPMIVHLKDRPQTGCILSGLVLEGAENRYLLTVGPLPAPASAAIGAAPSRQDLEQEAESHLRAGRPATLGLLGIEGWDRVATALPGEQLEQLTREIGGLIHQEFGKDQLVGEFGAGRFGVLATGTMDLSPIEAGLRDLIGKVADPAQCRIGGAVVELAGGGLDLSQSVRALRLVLTRFERGGKDAIDGLGSGCDLAAIIEEAGRHRQKLAATIEHRRFDLAYQPIVAFSDRRPRHFEALLRPALQADSPFANTQEFCTLTEAVGLSEDLDTAVVRRVVAAIRRTGLAIAANVSGLSIASAAFVQEVIDQAASVPAGRLIIEVTETSDILDLRAVALQIDRLRAAKIQVGLDDFGSGSASFRYMRELPVDFVKIDGAFVRAAGCRDQDRSFVCAIRDMARSTGAFTIAEMIETEETAALMAELGVDLGQGWLFGRPGAITPDAAPLLERWRF
jgi:EAL domain-containing protein (putative c-di-GMP-specific phosphodiesterase class I)